VNGSRMGGALRRAIGTVVTLALVGAAIGFYALSPHRSLTSGPGPVTTAEPAPTRTTIESASSSQTTTSPAQPSTRTATRTPKSSPDPDLPPGPGGREPGIRLTATPTAHGAFDVVETVRLAEPVTQLTLAPPDLTSANPDLRGKRPVAEALQVRAGGRAIKVANTTLRRATVLHVAEPAAAFELRYRLRGVTVINKPSSAGRALGAVEPLVTGVPAELPVAITVRGHSVRNLTCPRLPMAEWACAAGSQPNLRVNRNLPRVDALVAAQLDLTAPRVGAPR
jgi:hypothetical protein